MTNAEITRAVIALDLEARGSASGLARTEIDGQQVSAQVFRRIDGLCTRWTLGGDRIAYSKLMEKLLASAS
jgi:hypothetical protein